MLIKLCKEYMSSMGLKKYCESLIQSQQSEENLRSLYKSRHQLQIKQESQVLINEQLENEIIKGLLNQLISKIEIKVKQEECNKLRYSIASYTIERSKLTYSQDNLRNLIALKDQEMHNLKYNIKKVENQIEQLRKPYLVPDSSIFTLKI